MLHMQVIIVGSGIQIAV